MNTTRVRLMDSGLKLADSGSYRTRNSNCGQQACGNKTREGKPFCPDHIDHLPYVGGVLAKIAAREAEVEAVRRRGAVAVPADSQVVAEMLLFVALNGGATVERLRRERLHDETQEVANAYVAAMAKRGLVRTGKNTRGHYVVYPL